MDFELSQEQIAIRETIKRFMARECPRELAREQDEKAEFPEELFRKLADTGFLGLTVPEEYGGAESPDILAAVIVAEEISQISPALGGAYISAVLSGGRNIFLMGSQEQKEKYLPLIAEGRCLFTCGLSEPETGYSTVPTVQTVGETNGDHLTIQGTKSFVRLADRADILLALVYTGVNETREKGWSVVLIDMKENGVAKRRIETVGFRSLSFCDVSLNRVSVPMSCLLGGEQSLNAGWAQYTKMLETENLEIAACGLGIAQGAYEYALNYAKERVQFGKPIIKFQAVQQMLVDMATELDIARLLTYRAACFANQGAECLLPAVRARAYVTQKARQICAQALHILGGYGYTMEYDAQRYFRDSFTLLGGAKNSETLKEQMGRLLDM